MIEGEGVTPETATDKNLMDVVNSFLRNERNPDFSEADKAKFELWKAEAVRRGLITAS